MAQLVAHSLWERGVASSSLAAPTSFKYNSKGEGLEIKSSLPIRYASILLIFPVYCLFSHNLSVSVHTYKEEYYHQGVSWRHQYIENPDGQLLVTPHDICLIANLIYLSYARSILTLAAQDAALQTLDYIWKEWQNIAQTRLDPSVSLPYPHLEEKNYNPKGLLKLQQRHRSFGKAYTHAVTNIVNGHLLESSEAYLAVHEIRKLARYQVMYALLDVKQQLGSFFASQKNEPPLKTNFTDFIWSYIPQLALHSFVEANNINTTISEEGWNTLKSIQKVGNQTWRAIEEARAAFYFGYYTALYETIEKLNFPAKISIMFDEFGIIMDSQQITLLPHPKALSSTILQNFTFYKLSDTFIV